MRKIFLIIFLGVILFPSLSLAYTVYQTKGGTNVIYKGLVPCGKPVNLDGELSGGSLSGGFCCEMPCTFCHLFVMLSGIINFFLLPPPLGGGIVLFIAILMLVIGGAMFIFGYFAGGGEESPKLFSQGKKLITSVFIGLIIIFAAWLIVKFVFRFIGVASWTGLQERWFQIDCPTTAEKCDGRLTEEACQGIRAAGKIPCATAHNNGEPIDASECSE